MEATNVRTKCIGGQEYLTFNVDVKVTNTAEDKTYGPITGSSGNCHRVSFKHKIDEYARRYFKGSRKMRELRGTKLVKELENKLKVKMGSTITIPIKTSGEARSCKRFKKKRNHYLELLL